MNQLVATLLVLTVTLAWLIAIVRFARAIRRAFRGERIRWLIWAVVGGVLSASTGYLVVFLSGDNLSVIPSIFGSLTYAAGSQIGLNILPTYRRRRGRWAIWLGLAIALFLAGAGLWFRASPPIVDDRLRQLVFVPFNLYVVAVTARIVMPAIEWARWQEENPLARLRLSGWSLMYGVVIIWMLNDVLGHLLVGMGVDYRLDEVMRPLFVVVIGALFLVVYFGPPALFHWLARWLRYPIGLWDLLWLRPFAMLMYRWIEPKPAPLNFLSVLRSPDYGVYVTAINILDARKLLEGQTDPLAQDIGTDLRLSIRHDLEYPEVVAQLSRLSRRYVLAYLNLRRTADV